MKSSQPSSSFKLERKTLEKNRRMHMKSSCFKLASLIPPHYSRSKKRYSELDQVEQATAYIRKLGEDLQVLKEKRRALAQRVTGIDKDYITNDGMMMGELMSLPVIEVSDSGSRVDVLLVTGSNQNFTLRDAIGVIEEEGTKVFEATFFCAANKHFHIIHSLVISSRVGFDSARMCERLKEFVKLDSINAL